MSDANERPADRGSDGADRTAAAPPDPDAWATACKEDLAAEQARRRARYGTPPVDPVEELRRFADAVVDRIAQFGAPIAGTAARGAARQFFDQARAVVEPVVERNPAVFDHLAAAGQELLAAYRAAVEDQESRWTRSDGEEKRSEESGAGQTQQVELDPGKDGGKNAGRGGGKSAERDGGRSDDGPDDGPAGSERIDLD